MKQTEDKSKEEIEWVITPIISIDDLDTPYYGLKKKGHPRKKSSYYAIGGKLLCSKDKDLITKKMNELNQQFNPQANE